MHDRNTKSEAFDEPVEANTRWYGYLCLSLSETFVLMRFFVTIRRDETEYIEIEEICNNNNESQSEGKVKVVWYVNPIYNTSLVLAIDLHCVQGDKHNVADQANHVERDG